MNRLHHEPSAASAPYYCWQYTVRRQTALAGIHLTRKLTKQVGKQQVEKPIAATITMIIEAEEWARRALAAQGFGEM